MEDIEMVLRMDRTVLLFYKKKVGKTTENMKLERVKWEMI